MHGMGSEALQVFSRIPSHLIDEVIYVCILNACSHSGFVDKAQEIFSNIQKKSEKIYTVMVREIESRRFDPHAIDCRSIVSVVQLFSTEPKR